MKAVKSAISLEDFTLFQTSFKFLPSEDINVEAEDLFNSYEVNVDFLMRTDDEVNFNLFMKITVNNDETIAGYSLLAEGVCLFTFKDRPEITQDEKARFLQSAGLSIITNNLRTVFSNLTVNGPFGMYVLPILDTNDLLKKKGQLIAARRKEKESKKNKKSK